MSDSWEERKRPARLERRYEFKNYTQVRDFLDVAAELSEKDDYFPNMGFGADYLNVTIYAEEGVDELTDKQRQFAVGLDRLFLQQTSL